MTEEIPTVTPAIVQRYKRLAGPFACPAERPLLDGLSGFLAETKARSAVFRDAEGVCVWRLRSECETLEQTAARLRRIRPTKFPCPPSKTNCSPSATSSSSSSATAAWPPRKN